MAGAWILLLLVAYSAACSASRALARVARGDPRLACRSPDFCLASAGAARPPIPLGSAAPGQGDSRAAAARPGARVRLLGILRLCAGHRESSRFAVRRPLLGSDSRHFGRFYFGFVAVWAVAVAVAIAGLFVRRFVVRPVWLGKVSPESGVIAALIFVLMVTYLAGLWLAEGAAAGARELVAAHADAAGFPAADSAHQASAPGAQPDHGVSARARASAAFRRSQGDEDFGLDTGKDVTRIDALQAFTCVECGRCTEHCPAYNTGKVLNPKEIVLGLRGYLRRIRPGGEAPLLGRIHFRRGRLSVHHLRRLRVSVPGGHPASAADRRPAARRGEHRQMGRRLRHQAVPQPGAQRQRAGLRRRRAPEVHREERPADLTTARRSIACGWAAWAHTIRRAARSCWRWRACCATLGVTFGVLRKEKCTGDPARRLGNDLAVSAAGRGQYRDHARGQSEPAGFHLPALRAHHRHGLAGIRRRRSRSSTTANCWRACSTRLPAVRWHGRESGLPRPVLSGPLSRRVRRAAEVLPRATAMWSIRRAHASVRSAAARAAARCSWARRRASA